MRTDTAPTPTLLSDYTPPSHELTSVYLNFDLQPSATTVKSKIDVKRLRDEPLVLNGENISLKSCLLYTSPSPRDATLSRMPSSA